MSSPVPIRVMMLDDRETEQHCLSLFFRAFPDLEFVGRARGLQDAAELCAEFAPHVVAVDLKRPELDSADVIRRMRELCSIVHVILLTNSANQSVINGALVAGAMAVVPKNTTIDAIAAAIRAAALQSSEPLDG